MTDERLADAEQWRETLREPLEIRPEGVVDVIKHDLTACGDVIEELIDEVRRLRRLRDEVRRLQALRRPVEAQELRRATRGPGW